MTDTQADRIAKILEPILHLNGCQQRTAGYNDCITKQDIDTEDMERLEKLTLEEITQAIHKELTKARLMELEWVLNTADELSSTDLEKWEYHHDGLPLPAINPDVVEKRLAHLKREAGGENE